MACSWHLFGRGERVARSGNDGGCETHLCPAVVRVRTEEKFRRQDGSAASRMMGVGSFAEAAVVDERARIAGAAAVIAVDPVELKRTTALALGATAAVDPTAGDVAERIRELTHGRGVDYAFEVAGLEATPAPAHESLRSGGALVIVGVQSPATTFPFGPLEMFARETRVLGCMYGSTRMHRDVVGLVELAEARRLDIAALVSRRIALDEVNDALQAIERGEVIRSVIVS